MAKSNRNFYMNEVVEKVNSGDDKDFGYSSKLKTLLDSKLTSDRIESDLVDPSKPLRNNPNLFDSLYHASNMRRNRSEVYSGDKGGSLFTRTFRFGLFNPYGAISSAREFIFFTKPDLHLYKVTSQTEKSQALVKQDSKYVPNQGLNSYFWNDMFQHKDRIIRLLQAGYGSDDPFNHLLQNTVVSNLEVPSLTAPSIETSTNTYGVNLTYRGSSEESDDGPEFSLEFKDDRYLNVYSFFRAYEDYETLKKHGIIKPQPLYITNKILHDQFAIYKFIVDEDMESIIYWGKYYGVYPVSLPRDAFNNANFQDGLSFSISFKAAFYEDMRPEILYDFNSLAFKAFGNKDDGKNSGKYRDIDIYNSTMGRIDGRAAIGAVIRKVTGGPRANQNPNGYYYKLVWRGDDVV